MAVRKFKGTKDVRQALQDYMAKQRKIEKLKRKHGILDLEAEAQELKQAATLWAALNLKGGDQIECDGFHATLISQPYDSRFLATDEDRDEYIEANEPIKDRQVISLRHIVRKKFGPFSKGSQSSKIWRRITRPVVVKEALDEVVGEGLLTVEEITPSFVEKQKAPYLQFYED